MEREIPSLYPGKLFHVFSGKPSYRPSGLNEQNTPIIDINEEKASKFPKVAPGVATLARNAYTIGRFFARIVLNGG
jgi:hypothetical protein